MANRKINTKRSVDNYGGLTDIGHVYKRPDTYAGSTTRKGRLALIYDNGKLVEKEIKLPEAVERLFLEIISNAGDNCDSSRRDNVNPGKIDIIVTDTTIKITNGGKLIPIEKIFFEEKGDTIDIREYREGDSEFTWLPAYIFGKLRSSSHYDDENVIRTGAGRNGYGAKLTNIFSKLFTVIIEDPVSKTRFKSVWKDNMFKDNPKTKPEITVEKDENIKEGFLSIEWELDFERFKMKKYLIEDKALFCKIAVDYSFACKIITTFNGVEMDYRDIYKYSALIFKPEEMQNTIVKFSWGENEMEKLSDNALLKKIIEAKKPEHIPELEVLVLDTPDKGRIYSYVNGLMTKEGGTHVDCVLNPIYKFIADAINKDNNKKNKITALKIKPHISLVVNARLFDTEYESQSKNKLNFPTPKIILEDSKLKKMLEWDLMERLLAELDAMAFKNATKTDGKKNKHINEVKGSDANKAGTKDSHKCVLYIVEGQSAAGYPRERIDYLDGGFDYHGLAILKGILLNVSTADRDKYINNLVFSYIKKMMGFKEGLDYNIEKNIQTLRYGFMVLNVDADHDGMHILALFLNFLREKFPGVLKQNMVGYLRTPVIKVMKGDDKTIARFFTEKSYEEWIKTNSVKGLKVRYLKGLGSSIQGFDPKDDLKHAPTIFCIYSEKDNANFDLAFNKHRADERKEWIAKWRDVTQIEDIVSVDLKDILKGKNKLEGAQDTSQLINRELVDYSVASLKRCIPSEYDLLKDSQRKALYATLKYFNYDPKKGKEIKVGRLVYKAADMTQYHHGETSLVDTFIKMAQDFVGTNNMGYFKKNGMFGTRADGGDEAAAARYSETHLAWWIPFVYYKESVEFIEKTINEDEECEPLWLPGVIPMGVVNGFTGIATGFSTSSQPHNPIDVVEWYIKRLTIGDEVDPILPWYNNFTGKLEIKDKSKEKETKVKNSPFDALERTNEEREEQEIEENDNENLALLKHHQDSKISLKTYGKMEIIEAKKDDVILINITELPIRKFTEKYINKYIKPLLHEKKNFKVKVKTNKINKDEKEEEKEINERAIIDYDNKSTTTKINIFIKWNKNYPIKPDYVSLGLISGFGLSNITLIDHKGFPSKFDSIQEIMERYYIHMIEHFEDIRKNRIKLVEDVIIDINFILQYIKAINDKKIEIMDVKEDYVKEKMEELKIPFKYYDIVKIRDLSVESPDKYNKKLEEAKNKLEEVKKVSAKDIWLGKLEIFKKELLKRKSGKFFNFNK